jgi:hypothetical protein
VAATLVIASQLFLVPGVPVTAATESGGMRVVGTVPLWFEEDPVQGPNPNDRAQTGWLVINPTTRRGYQVFEWNSTTPARSTIIQSFDLDTLRPIRRASLAGVLPMRGAGKSTEGVSSVMHAVDEAGGRIFLALASSNLPQAADGSADGQPPFARIEVIDERAYDRGAETFSTRMEIPPAQAGTLALHHLRALQFHRHAGTGRLLLLWSDVAANGQDRVRWNHQLVQWGVDRPSDTWDSPALLTDACGGGRLTSAPQNINAMYQLAILRTDTHLVLACNATKVLRIRIDADGRPTGDVQGRSLPSPYGDTVADHAAGRLYVRSAGTSGMSWWAYDVGLDAFTGRVAVSVNETGQVNAAGLDPDTGRFYALIPNHYYHSSRGDYVPVAGGLAYSDARLDPPPQAAFALRSLNRPSAAWIAVDPARQGRPRRLFVRHGSFTGSCYGQTATDNARCPALTDDFLHVIEDHEPLSVEADEADVDRYTTDVAEVPGTTAVNFDRSASGFGTRLLLTGGVSGATGAGRALDPGSFATHGSGCMPADRELVLAHVESAESSNVATAATARGLTVDPGTQADLRSPSHRCWPAPAYSTFLNSVFPPPPAATATAGQDVEGAETSCTADDASPEAVGSRGTARSAVTCNGGAGRFTASASAGAGTGDVVVATSTSTARVDKDNQGRTVVSVVSQATGIAVPGVAGIGRVTVTARARAGGRRGTAGTDFTREICDVSVVGTTATRGCLTPTQQDEFVARLNQALGTRGYARLRQPDAAYAAGSPGGYQSAIQKRRPEQFGDSQIVRDRSKAVYGLEIAFDKDDATYGAARQIFQFAGVQAANQYGIYCVEGANPARTGCLPPGAASLDTTLPTGLAAMVGGLTDSDHHEGGTGTSLSALPSATDSPAAAGRPPLLRRILRGLAQLPTEALRMLFSGSRELPLLAGVWALVWLPCFLGERRRKAAALVAQRGKALVL